MKGLNQNLISHNGVKYCPDCGVVTPTEFSVSVTVNGKTIEITDVAQLSAIGQVICLESYIDSDCPNCDGSTAFPVDPSMTDVVKQIYTRGYKTRFSCCGESDAQYSCIPYVVFQIPEATAPYLKSMCKDTNNQWYLKDTTNTLGHYWYNGFMFQSKPDVADIENVEQFPAETSYHIGVIGCGKVDIVIEHSSRYNDGYIQVSMYNQCHNLDYGWNMLYKLLDNTSYYMNNKSKFVTTYNENEYCDLVVPPVYELGKVYYVRCEPEMAERISEAYSKCGSESVLAKYNKPKAIVNAISNFADTGFVVDLGWHEKYTKTEIMQFCDIAKILNVSINFMGSTPLDKTIELVEEKII